MYDQISHDSPFHQILNCLIKELDEGLTIAAEAHFGSRAFDTNFVGIPEQEIRDFVKQYQADMKEDERG